MTRKQCIEIAVFSAEQVLGEYESRYPNDKRPRDAINAAKAVLKDDTEENRRAANAAANDAVDAARTAAHAADAAYAAADAADYAAAAASYAAAYAAAAAAANAAAYAAYAAHAAYAAYANNAAAMRARIIDEAVRILDGSLTSKSKLSLPDWW
jgi:hypothetical protein